MALPEYGVGKEVLSNCTKCKLNLAHIIVVMKSDKTPGKVQCKTCQSVHAYKDPFTKRISTKTGKRTKTVDRPVAEVWAEALEKSPPGDALKYSIKTKFALGDVISHPTFGDGVIEKTKDGNKIDVIFESDIKTLVHNME